MGGRWHHQGMGDYAYMRAGPVETKVRVFKPGEVITVPAKVQKIFDNQLLKNVNTVTPAGISGTVSNK